MKPTCRPSGLFFLIASAVFVTNCTNKTPSPGTITEQLTSTWDWVQSTGGIDGRSITPATEGYKRTITFEKNGVYSEGRDGKQTSQMKYTVSQGKSIYSDTAYLVDYRSSGKEKQPRSIRQSVRFGGTDTLFLNDECYDCFEHVYTRKN